MSADKHHIGIGFGYAARHSAYPGLGDQLHADPRARVDLSEVVDQLRQVLNRIDIVMGRGRNQRDAFHGAADAGNEWSHLVSGQLPPLAGFRALRHLDFQFLGSDQVLGRHAESR